MFYVDQKKLDGKIVEKGMTKDSLAEACGIDRSTLYRRIKNGTLRICDIHIICETLGLTGQESCEIFLAQKSHKCDC